MSGPPASSFENMSILKALKNLLPPEGFKLLVKKLYADCFGHITLPDDIFAYLIPIHAPQEVLEEARKISQSSEFKLAFEKEHVDLVNNHGVFGMPWISLNKPGETHLEHFWGSDRMSAIAHWLGPNYAYTGARIDRETVKCETHNAIS
ncbi:Glutathione S-transferase-like protein [Ceratobasidium theobromae]|uniref:Glutathione S-transferase-like protein n=1 Tax=Ceratobasidium theobromae TaxID=1582974 RepID=A0A5N5QWA2_9AGAM|nr:Glutathione S-transferase-like protein [Ceratobasidium theobromae]